MLARTKVSSAATMDKGSPLSLLSWNLLAPSYYKLGLSGREYGAKVKVEAQLRTAWERRLTQQLLVLKELGPDCLCLQELWFKPDTFKMIRTVLGDQYAFHCVRRTAEKEDGVAILVSRRWTVHEARPVEFSDSGNRVMMMVCLESVADPSLTAIVATTHLTYPHTENDAVLRLNQAKSATAHLLAFAREMEVSKSRTSIINQLSTAAISKFGVPSSSSSASGGVTTLGRGSAAFPSLSSAEAETSTNLSILASSSSSSSSSGKSAKGKGKGKPAKSNGAASAGASGSSGGSHLRFADADDEAEMVGRQQQTDVDDRLEVEIDATTIAASRLGLGPDSTAGSSSSSSSSSSAAASVAASPPYVPSIPLILVGDFNHWQDEALVYLRSSGWKDCFAACLGAESGMATSPTAATATTTTTTSSSSSSVSSTFTSGKPLITHVSHSGHQVGVDYVFVYSPPPALSLSEKTTTTTTGQPPSLPLQLHPHLAVAAVSILPESTPPFAIMARPIPQKVPAPWMQKGGMEQGALAGLSISPREVGKMVAAMSSSASNGAAATAVLEAGGAAETSGSASGILEGEPIAPPSEAGLVGAPHHHQQQNQQKEGSRGQTMDADAEDVPPPPPLSIKQPAVNSNPMRMEEDEGEIDEEEASLRGAADSAGAKSSSSLSSRPLDNIRVAGLLSSQGGALVTNAEDADDDAAASGNGGGASSPFVPSIGFVGPASSSSSSSSAEALRTTAASVELAMAVADQTPPVFHPPRKVHELTWRDFCSLSDHRPVLAKFLLS
jgi:hypothetical protein